MFDPTWTGGREMKRDNKSVVHQVLRERFKACMKTRLARTMRWLEGLSEAPENRFNSNREGWCPQCHIPMLNIQNDPSGNIYYRCPECGKDYINFNTSVIVDFDITAGVKK